MGESRSSEVIMARTTADAAASEYRQILTQLAYKNQDTDQYGVFARQQ